MYPLRSCLPMLAICIAALPLRPGCQTSTGDVEAIVQQITHAAGYTKGIRLLEDTLLSNALAVVADSTIKYNPHLIAICRRDTAAPYAVQVLFAHEIAHLVLGHGAELADCDQLAPVQQNERRVLESAADQYAGLLLNRLCIGLEDALRGFRCVHRAADDGPCYFPAGMRESSIGDGWLDEEYAVRKALGRRHPCDLPKGLFFAENRYRNEAQHVYAEPVDGQMRITYNLPDGRSKPYRVFLALAPTVPITPTRFYRSARHDQPGTMQDTLIWDYASDRYSRADALYYSDSFSVAAFARRHTPRFFRPWERGLFCTGIVAGLAATGYGIYLKAQANDLYDTYRQNLDPYAALYQNGALSREKTYAKANRLNT